MIMSRTIILASKSPRRKQLLAAAGIAFRIYPSQVQEVIQSHWTPEQCATNLAQQKAQWVVDRLRSEEENQHIVLGADTVVAIGNEIFGKPANDEDAYQMLWRLSRTPHRVITGICLYPLWRPKCIVDYDITFVHMRPLNDKEIKTYIESREGADKAGSYAIQETAESYVNKIEGDYDNVVGLPVALVKQLILRC